MLLQIKRGKERSVTERSPGSTEERAACSIRIVVVRNRNSTFDMLRDVGQSSRAATVFLRHAPQSVAAIQAVLKLSQKTMGISTLSHSIHNYPTAHDLQKQAMEYELLLVKLGINSFVGASVLSLLTRQRCSPSRSCPRKRWPGRFLQSTQVGRVFGSCGFCARYSSCTSEFDRGGRGGTERRKEAARRSNRVSNHELKAGAVIFPTNPVVASWPIRVPLGQIWLPSLRQNEQRADRKMRTGESRDMNKTNVPWVHCLDLDESAGHGDRFDSTTYDHYEERR